MIRWLLFACSFLFFASLKSQIIAVESFSYPPSAPLAGQGAPTDGWSGSWTLVSGDESGICSEDSLVVNDLMIRSELPVALLPSGDAHVLRRPFDQPLPTDFWFSFLSKAAGNVFAKGSLGFYAADAPTGEELRVEVGKTFATNTLVTDGIHRYPRRTNAGYPNGHWTVGRFFPETDSTTLLYLWTNPEPDALLVPDTATADVRARQFLATTLDGVQLTALDRSGLDWWVDDLYFGHTFADVVPDDWTPVTVSNAPLPAHEGFDYPAGEPIVGQSGGTGFAGPWEDRNNFAHELSASTIPFGDGLETLPAAAELLLNGSGTNNRYVRPLVTPYPDDGSVYWLGVVLDIEHSAMSNVGQVYLANSALVGPSGPAGQVLQIGRAPEAPSFSIGVPPGDYTYLGSNLAAAPRWAVVKITTSGDAALDTVDIWFDPHPTVDAPPISDRAGRRFLSLNNGWDALGMKVEGQGMVSMLVDDLALGNTYQDVVPPYLLTSVPELEQMRTWTVFPNPGDGTLRLKEFPPGATTLLAYDASGRFLRRLPLQSTMQILKENAPAGLYFLVLTGSEESWLVRYVKR